MGERRAPKYRELGWSRRATRVLFTNKWYRLRQDDITLPQGKTLTYTYVEHPGSVFIVPVNAVGKIILIRSYRYTLDEWCWEVPAGFLGDNPEKTPQEVAAEELATEIGGIAKAVHPLGCHYLANGFANNLCYFYLGESVQLVKAQQLEDTETIDRIEAFSVEEVRAMIRRGEIRDGDSAFAILLALQWQPDGVGVFSGDRS